MNNKRRLTNKYILLAILLIAVFVLPSCRTRISNNSEITTVQYDESGFMSEDYQMRRDELGLSTAEKPLLPNFGSGESDDSDDFEEGEYIDYNPEDYQEDFTEPETNTNNNNNNRNNSNTGTRNRSTTPSSDTSTTKKYTVTFKGNGGTPDKQTREFIRHSKISFPTQPERKGYEFTGWYTEADNNKGSKVDTSVTVSSDRTLYAHWKKKKTDPTTPEEYSITLDYNDGETKKGSITVLKDGKYSELKDPPKRIGWKFLGWYFGDSKITKSTKIKKNEPHTLKAKWKYMPNEFWENEFKEAANSIEADEKYKCFVDDGDGGENNLIETCKGDVEDTTESEAQYVIKFVKGLDEQKATDEADKIRSATVTIDDTEQKKYSNVDKVILIDSEAISTDNDALKILYKMKIIESIYGSELWINGNDLDKAKGSEELNGNPNVIVK